eukprot:6192031-Pleurochrysis_carterae.AAC.5
MLALDIGWPRLGALEQVRVVTYLRRGKTATSPPERRLSQDTETPQAQAHQSRAATPLRPAPPPTPRAPTRRPRAACVRGRAPFAAASRYSARASNPWSRRRRSAPSDRAAECGGTTTPAKAEAAPLTQPLTQTLTQTHTQRLTQPLELTFPRSTHSSCRGGTSPVPKTAAASTALRGSKCGRSLKEARKAVYWRNAMH